MRLLFFTKFLQNLEFSICSEFSIIDGKTITGKLVLQDHENQTIQPDVIQDLLHVYKASTYAPHHC